ncbi:MAG TPA: hypothetical protein VFV93_14460 [Thermomicrobiales bacterium]|nr:hypothetical protein [Thermomicrobiales bacterium]
MIRHAMLMMVVVLLAVSLTGCGGDDDDDDATDSSGTTATTGTTSDAAGTEGVADSLYTTAELEQFGTDLVNAVASGDKDALTATLSGVVPQSRIDELAACKPADLETSNVFVSVIVEPPVMKMSGTVDVTTGGDTQTKVVNWQTELSEVSPGVYTFSSLGEGCPFIFQ